MADSSNNSILNAPTQQHRSGNLTEAAKNYRKFLKKDPAHAGALYLLGCLEYQRGKNDEATDLLLEAVTLAPHEADYHNALGLALIGLEKFDDAEQSFRRALQLENRGAFHLNLGLLRRRQKRAPEALEHLCEALKFQPDNTELICEIGDIQQEMGDFAGASQTYQQALIIEPELARAWYSRGCAETAHQEFVPAAECFQEAINLQPEWLQARHNLARALYEIGQVTEACRHFAECNLPESRAMLAVIIPGDPRSDNHAVLTARRHFADTDLPKAPANTARSPKDVLRIGYVSSFFQRDNWMKPVWGLINQHDRAKCLVNLFSDCPVSAIKHGYQEHLSDRFFNTASLNNAGLANLIKEAGIDVLIDLNGFSNMRRLPLYALRPSPVTIGWFNLYATTGMNGFDYLIGDEQVIPKEEEPRVLRENLARTRQLSHVFRRLSSAGGRARFAAIWRRHLRLARVSIQTHTRSDCRLEPHSRSRSTEQPTPKEQTPCLRHHARVSPKTICQPPNRYRSPHTRRAGRSFLVPQNLRPRRYCPRPVPV